MPTLISHRGGLRHVAELATALATLDRDAARLGYPIRFRDPERDRGLTAWGREVEILDFPVDILWAASPTLGLTPWTREPDDGDRVFQHLGPWAKLPYPSIVAAARVDAGGPSTLVEQVQVGLYLWGLYKGPIHGLWTGEVVMAAKAAGVLTPGVIRPSEDELSHAARRLKRRFPFGRA